MKLRPTTPKTRLSNPKSRVSLQSKPSQVPGEGQQVPGEDQQVPGESQQVPGEDQQVEPSTYKPDRVWRRSVSEVTQHDIMITSNKAVHRAATRLINIQIHSAWLCLKPSSCSEQLYTFKMKRSQCLGKRPLRLKAQPSCSTCSGVLQTASHDEHHGLKRTSLTQTSWTQMSQTQTNITDSNVRHGLKRTSQTQTYVMESNKRHELKRHGL